MELTRDGELVEHLCASGRSRGGRVAEQLIGGRVTELARYRGGSWISA